MRQTVKEEVASARPDKQPRRPLSWRKKLVFGLLTTGLFLVVFEGILAVCGVRPVLEQSDPYVGFARSVPLFVPVADTAPPQQLITSPGKQVWFNPQTFVNPKPSGVNRVFCVGGSTTFGRPYSDSTSYVGWLRALLPVVDSDQTWEVINAGGVSYASYRIAALMEELVQYQPDLFIVYVAQNEFLERRTYAAMFEQPPMALALQAASARTRTFALVSQILKPIRSSEGVKDILPAEVDERLNHTIGPVDYTRDDVWQSQVLRHYELNLKRMIALARSVGADVVLVTPASNEKDYSPFKSVLDGSLTAEQQARVEQLQTQAAIDQQAARWDEGVNRYREVLAIDPRLAESRYQLGRCLYELERYPEAQSEFRAAINEDVCPLRAIDSIVSSIRTIASEERIPLVDFERLLRQESQAQLGHACLGNEYFLDHVHPNIEVHQRLACWIIDRLIEVNMVEGDGGNLKAGQSEFDLVVKRIYESIDLQQHGVALRNLAKVLHWSGKFELAAARASDALDLLPGDPESRFVLADCLKNMGDVEGALSQYEQLFADGRDYGRAYLPYGELLSKCGHYEQSKAYCMLAIMREPDNAYAYLVLANSHLALGENEFARESLDRAAALKPSQTFMLDTLKQMQAQLGSE
jgi:tetratricopeptide (TPR) repeat protein